MFSHHILISTILKIQFVFSEVVYRPSKHQTKFRNFLHGGEFLLVMDMSPLSELMLILWSADDLNLQSLYFLLLVTKSEV